MVRRPEARCARGSRVPADESPQHRCGWIDFMNARPLIAASSRGNCLRVFVGLTAYFQAGPEASIRRA